MSSSNTQSESLAIMPDIKLFFVGIHALIVTLPVFISPFPFCLFLESNNMLTNEIAGIGAWVVFMSFIFFNVIVDSVKQKTGRSNKSYFLCQQKK